MRPSRTVAPLFALLLLAGCERAKREPAAAAITVTDDDGRVVRLDAPARRIISLIPARTDVILALNEEERLIARTVYDADPRLADLPTLSNALTPSVEWLLEQRPDLVVAWPDRQSRSVVTRLAELGVPVYASNVETLDEVRHAVRDMGRLIGREAGADSLVAQLDSALAAVHASVAGQPPRRVLYLIGLDPPIAAGPGTFVHELIEAAGGVNAMADAGAPWPPISAEAALAAEPDVIVVGVGEQRRDAIRRQLETLPGWRSLEAVREDRIHIVDADLFNRAGPTLVQAVRQLASLLHPGTEP